MRLRISLCIYIYIYIHKTDEWATTKQACRDEMVVLFAVFFYYFVKLYHPGIEHCITEFNATP